MKTFKTGDVVEYIGKSTSWDKGDIHIIHECEYQGRGRFEYSTTQGAWFKASDFKLIRLADKQSFKELDDMLKEEYGDF